MSEVILICTVGGSHQPILTALNECRPSHTLFVCSGTDPATGRPGSSAMVIGKDKPIEVRRGDSVEGLANLPTLAGLTEGQWEYVEVPPDDLDAAVAIIIRNTLDLRRRFPGARFVADYTGGTKTMTAALVISGLELDGVELKIVTGARANLVKVHDGSQSGLSIDVEGIRMRRAMAPYLTAWGRFAYGEAAEGLAGLSAPRDPLLRAELQISTGLSRAFDTWDRFDHRAALEQMEVYRQRIGSNAGAWLNAVKLLVASPDDPKREPARLWDLWLNAQRRATQARYDDAVARLYRLIEWTAQWLLVTKGIRTGDLQASEIPPTIQIHPTAKGNLKAGLRDAWELAAYHLDGPVRAFVEAEREHLLDHLLRRNASILAHGDRPIDRSDWNAFSQWAEAALIPLLRSEAARVGLKNLCPQLPTAPLWRP
ncbi:TIGR02710 family CRISPR-associated CARF protein [Thiocapsa sp.]|uniref:TIGR02710 family CRISPR-associated CARF protein n=1 Tax=Thiocapsa sp. TaxID=2024551 RepID=UPI002C1C5F58|nr:TIGR02710 family CRISPR-associated CARF protein [Thiocapsa sp.]HSO81788.1 TIGR02710 family CRISPR-associated CARF protein [Thiocapsa sp.]